jgi:uncharacterized membrane protein
MTNGFHPPDDSSDPDEASASDEARAFSGPLPSPEMLRAYDTLLPGAADRIIEMAANEQKFRHHVEYRVFREEARYRIVSFLIGSLLFIIVVGVLVFGAVNGATWTVLISPVLSLFGVLVGYYFAKSESPLRSGKATDDR